MDIEHSSSLPSGQPQNTIDKEEYNSDIDLDLNEDSDLNYRNEEYDELVNNALSDIDCSMNERHQIATIKYSFEKSACDDVKATPNFIKFELDFHARCDDESKQKFESLTKDLYQKGAKNITEQFTKLATDCIKEKNDQIKAMVQSTKIKLPIHDKAAGTSRARLFTRLEELKQKWERKFNEFKTRYQKGTRNQQKLAKNRITRLENPTPHAQKRKA